MRILMRVEFDVETANAAARDGTLAKKIQAILDEQKPEAAYFMEFDGTRTGIIVVNLTEESQIPALAEPWFLALNAKLELRPAMVPADLAKASAAIAAAAKKYG